MIRQDIKFDFDDILIVPKDQSSIDTRSIINVYDENEMLPLFTAPMDTVVGNENMEIFKQNKIYPIIPRTSKFLDFTKSWVALGLNDFEKLIKEKYLYDFETYTYYILIDIANGNMKKMHDLIVKSKNIYGDKLQLMVGNISNPETYKIISELGADYCRIGVGNGGGCWIEGTKVLTKCGYKKIENITTDDEVLTHTGEWKPVIMTHELNYNEDLIEINGEISTKDHQYYVINKNESHLITDNNYQKYAYWIDAVGLTDNHLLLEMEKK